MGYTFCDTYEAAAQAADALSRHHILILDCEGRNIGMPDGALGLIAIGDSTASHIYLFDTVALSDKTHPLLSRLFILLRNSQIVKLVWDGRSDFFEIADTYGVLMQGVVDLQLAEVIQRNRTNKPGKPGIRARHTLDYFKKIKDEVISDPRALDGIHRLIGLDHCAGLFHVSDGSKGKDPTVVAMHRENGSEMWLIRPLPDLLIKYSCHDIELIAALYTSFNKKGKYLHPLDQLKTTTERYLHSYPTRELRALHVSLDLCKFLPMEVLTPPVPSTPHYDCIRCMRVLSLSCFFVDHAHVKDGEGMSIGQARMSICRLCALVARRNAESVAIEWIRL